MTDPEAGPGYGAGARSISLVLAGAASVVLLVFPYLLGNPLAPRVHAVLPLLLLGIAGAWVHGLGFIPKHRLPRLLASPAFVWPLLIVTSALIARLRT
jgi:predicted membrane protein